MLSHILDMDIPLYLVADLFGVGPQLFVLYDESAWLVFSSQGRFRGQPASTILLIYSATPPCTSVP